MKQILLSRFRIFSALLLTILLLSQIPLAKAEYVVSFDGEFKLSVRVVPRIGAFFSDAYQESWDQKCIPQRIDGLHNWKTYFEKLDSSPDPLGYTLPEANDSLNAALAVPSWDILTSRPSGGRKDCGYRARRVLLTVNTANSRGPVECKFTFKKGLVRRVEPIPSDSCIHYIALSSNAEEEFEVEVTNRLTGKQKRLVGTVPEDILIASLGDSYASGEGNPDVPTGKTARWMDAWCHRSVYAGPLRAAVRIIRQQDDIKNVRYRRALSAGALTVVSFACSGALVSKGLNGPYEGVIDYRSALEAYPDLEKLRARASREQFGEPVEIESQLQQLENFMLNQEINRKRSVDMLLLSGGGNDLQFGKLVTAMVLKNTNNVELKKSINESLAERFKTLESSYSTFRNALTAFDEKYPAAQVLLVKYPDPLYRSIGVNCSGKIEMNTAELAIVGKIIDLAYFVGQLRLDDAEINEVRASH